MAKAHGDGGAAGGGGVRARLGSTEPGFITDGLPCKPQSPWVLTYLQPAVTTTAPYTWDAATRTLLVHNGDAATVTVKVG